MSSQRVMLTARDGAILKDLSVWGVLSLAQIRRRHFVNLAESVSSERITKLHNAGLVCKQRVGILIHHGRPKEIGTVVTLTVAGLRIVHGSKTDCHKSLRPKPLNTSELHHDLLLVELADALRKKHPNCHMVLGESSGGHADLLRRVPDLVMSLASEHYAVELELTAKSSTRYRQILASYQVSSNFDRVLYVVGNTHIAVKIARILRDHITATSPFGNFGRISLEPLKEYFSEPNYTGTLEKITNNKKFGEKLNEKQCL